MDSGKTVQINKQRENMKIAITGGKGGTGKSTVAVAIAHFLSKSKKVLLVDLDVDCPGDHLLSGLELEKVKDIENMVPKIDQSKCQKCGKCASVCPENAIAFVKGNFPIIVPEQCIGCGACKIVCPFGAITEEKQIIGEIFKAKRGNLTLISGKMKPNIEESSLVINAVKKYTAPFEKEYDHVIIDTAAGTHCPVIAALLGVEYALAITEPTALGAHDLDLILDLAEKLGIPFKIMLNRAGIGPENLIEKVSAKHNTQISAKLPYSREIEQFYCSGRPVEHESIEYITNLIFNKQ